MALISLLLESYIMTILCFCFFSSPLLFLPFGFICDQMFVALVYAIIVRFVWHDAAFGKL